MVFVTGGTGLVGSHLICHLLSQGCKVRALCRLNSDKTWFNRTAKWLLKDQYDDLKWHLEWVVGDVTDIVSLIDGAADCSQVYHAAGIVSFAKRDQDILKKINVEGTANVVNACLGFEKSPDLCFISSTASIGGVEKIIVNESQAYSAEVTSSYYSVTKYLAELEVIRGREEGLNVAIINPCIVLGFGNWNQGPSRFFKNGKNGFPFYTEGSNAFVDARDVAIAAAMLMEQKCFEQKFLCTGWNKKFVQVFSEISSGFKSKPPRIRVNHFLAELAWRLAGVFRFFSGKGIITKESARAGIKKMSYTSQRLIDAVGMEFRPFEKSIAEICAAYADVET